MLATALWFAAVLGLLTAVLLDGTAGFGRAGVQAAADHAVEAAMHDAVARYQNGLQAAIAGADPASLAGAAPAASAPPLGGYATPVAAVPTAPVVATPDPQATDGGPRFTVITAVVPTTLAAPACAPGAEQAGADTVAWLQCNGFVQESRMSLRVSVQVLDGSGAQLLARREQYVTLRLFDLPPYSAVVGRKDGGADSPTDADPLAPPAHEGDLGGDTLSGASAGPQPSPWPAGDSGTLIHARFTCSGAGCAGADPPDPDAGLRAGARWTDGNLAPPSP